MYIGQKKNFWVVDLQSDHRWKTIEHRDGIVKLHVDDLKTYVDKLWDNWFVDEMVAEGKEMMDSVFGEDKYDMYRFGTNDEMTKWQNGVVKLLEPNYMIEANID